MSKKTFEAALTGLVDRVAPADLRIRRVTLSPELEALLPREIKKTKHYSVSFQTRSFDEGANASSVRDAVDMALGSLETGPKDIDPVVPNWYALSRMQREVVEQALKRLVAEHKARGATKNLAHDSHARLEYEIADAFEAALESLEFEYENEPGTVWEPLAARGDQQTRLPTTPADEPGAAEAVVRARRKKVSTAVKELREKNQANARPEGLGSRPGAKR